MSGRNNKTGDNSNPEQATHRENVAGPVWGGHPATNEVSNDNNARQIYKHSDRRTDIRSIDQHYSWREVYYACHIGVGIDG